MQLEIIPGRVQDCEAKCVHNSQVTFKMKIQMEKHNEMLCDFENRKQERLPYEEFRDDHAERMINVEKTFSFMKNKIQALENYLDVYMPLRLQH